MRPSRRNEELLGEPSREPAGRAPPHPFPARLEPLDRRGSAREQARDRGAELRVRDVPPHFDPERNDVLLDVRETIDQLEHRSPRKRLEPVAGAGDLEPEL